MLLKVKVCVLNNEPAGGSCYQSVNENECGKKSVYNDIVDQEQFRFAFKKIDVHHLGRL